MSRYPASSADVHEIYVNYNCNYLHHIDFFLHNEGGQYDFLASRRRGREPHLTQIKIFVANHGDLCYNVWVIGEVAEWSKAADC